MTKQPDKIKPIGDHIDIKIGDDARNLAVGKEVRQTIGKNAAAEEATQATAFESLASTAAMNVRQLSANYEQARQQAGNWSQASLVAALVGLALVVVGIILLLSGNTPIGIVTSIVGVVSEATSTLFFRQAKAADDRQDAYHRDLVIASGVNQAIELCETMAEGDAKERIKEAVVKQVMGIKN